MADKSKDNAGTLIGHDPEDKLTKILGAGAAPTYK